MLYQLVQCVPLLRPACLLCGASSLWWGNVVGGGDLVLGALKAPFFSCCVFGCTGLCKGMWGTGRKICDILAPPLPFMAFSSPALFTALQLSSHSCHGADVRSQVPFLRRNLFLPLSPPGCSVRAAAQLLSCTRWSHGGWSMASAAPSLSFTLSFLPGCSNMPPSNVFMHRSYRCVCVKQRILVELYSNLYI